MTARARVTAVLLAVAAAAISGVQAQQASRDHTSDSIASGTAVLSGVVLVDDARGEPVRRAIVTIASADDGLGATTVTDDEGHFRFDDLPAGRFNVTASRPAFVTTRLGARAIGRPGTPMAIADGEQRAVTLRMPRGAVITGVVRDGRGAPLSGVTVEPLIFQFVSGRKQLERATYISPGQTDDRGEYRLYGLAPGEYYVAARAPRLGNMAAVSLTTEAAVRDAMRVLEGGLTPTGFAYAAPETPPSVGYARVYFPGTTSRADARTVRVEAGQERFGFDLQLRFVPLVTVSGRATQPDGSPAAFARGQLASLDGTVDSGLSGIVLTNHDGRFTVQGVAPGRYALGLIASVKVDPTARSPLSGKAELWGTAQIDVRGDNLTGVDIAMRPTLQVSGRVIFEGTGDPPVASTLRIYLQAQIEGDEVATNSADQRVLDDGMFVIEGVTPGRYRLATSSLKDWSLRSVRVGGREVLDLPFSIEADTNLEGIEITITDRKTSLSGTLQDASGHAAPDYYIVVFSADRRYWPASTRRIRTARPATDGRFQVADLPAGAYLLAALIDVESGEWLDPDFLDKLMPGTIPITLVEGQETVQDVRIAGGGVPIGPPSRR